MPARADWKLLAAEAATDLAKIRAIYAGFTPSSIEAQTEDVTRRYAQIADLATVARGFGLTVDDTLWPELVRQASRGRETIMLLAIARLLSQAEAAAEEQRFFHWDLEFPYLPICRF